MHLAYAGESGSPGSGSTFSLACVIIPAQTWPAAFDDLIRYRRF